MNCLWSGYISWNLSCTTILLRVGAKECEAWHWLNSRGSFQTQRITTRTKQKLTRYQGSGLFYHERSKIWSACEWMDDALLKLMSSFWGMNGEENELLIWSHSPKIWFAWWVRCSKYESLVFIHEWSAKGNICMLSNYRRATGRQDKGDNHA